MSTGPLVIIDGHNTFIRNYVRSPYTDANGERMGGATGMVISVRKIINDLRASNVLVIWDGEGGSQRRRSIYKEYKAGRTVRLNEREGEDFGETPEQKLENMRKQRNIAQEYLTILGVPQVRCAGVEADDLMAFVAAQMDHPGGCVIVTTDQDLLQLIRAANKKCPDRCSSGFLSNVSVHVDCSCAAGIEQPDSTHSPDCQRYEHGLCKTCDGLGTVPQTEVRVFSPIKKVMYDHTKFVQEYGVLPENFRFVKALTGDSSDNIEGIKGFGVKTIAKNFPFLAERPVSLQEMIDSGPTLKGVLGKRFVEGNSRFLENLQLVDLSEPMLSATAGRQAREALSRDLGCKEVEFRVRIVKDAISFGGDNFVGPFRDLTVRRKRLLKDLGPFQVETDLTADQTAVEETAQDE